MSTHTDFPIYITLQVTFLSYRINNSLLLFFYRSVRYYLFISHTGYGGVAYAMAITCLTLGADAKFVMEETAETHFVSTSLAKNVSIKTSTDIALRQGDYRDILNLIRVLVHGPKSKEEVDAVIDRYVV
jgi:hypothetical protein